jgi:hypothetical protein
MCYMVIGDAGEAVLAEKFAVMRPFLDERGWRVYLGTEANALGYGGVAAVARASGASETTVAAGAAEAADPEALTGLEAGRSRRAGAGRPRAEKRQPGLKDVLKNLLEEGKRGDPMSEITWSVLSLRDIARQLERLGSGCSKDTVARLMREDGWSLQGMAKVVEGKQHGDRDPQFRNIGAEIARAIADGEPVISVDGKKKENLGAYHRDGKSWQRQGEPVRVRDHDFPDKDTVTIVPYGIYDIAANRGLVSVGTSHDTAAFAVNAIRLWWQQEGSLRYPHARRLLITCDAGGANDWRSRLWKDQLAVLAAETGLRIEVMHFPPGTSKWNKIEHSLFCHITRTWRARPLMTISDAVAGIAATITAQGLKCTAVTDDGHYPEGVKISDARMRYLHDCVLERGEFHGEWNYAFLPVPRPAPAPGPEPEPAGPDPALIASLAALAGLTAPRALLEKITPAWDAGREYRLALDRGRERLRPHAKAYRRLSDEALLTAAACRIRLGMTWALLGRLLGVHPSSISDPARWAIPVLDDHGITAQPGTPRITTTVRLLEHAAAAGITLPGITLTREENGRTQEDPDTPKTANLKNDGSITR